MLECMGIGFGRVFRLGYDSDGVLQLQDQSATVCTALDSDYFV